jgi:hypothetical protein
MRKNCPVCGYLPGVFMGCYGHPVKMPWRGLENLFRGIAQAAELEAFLVAGGEAEYLPPGQGHAGYVWGRLPRGVVLPKELQRWATIGSGGTRISGFFSEQGKEDNDYCCYCGADNGLNGEFRVGWDCGNCGGN